MAFLALVVFGLGRGAYDCNADASAAGCGVGIAVGDGVWIAEYDGDDCGRDRGGDGGISETSSGPGNCAAGGSGDVGVGSGGVMVCAAYVGIGGWTIGMISRCASGQNESSPRDSGPVHGRRRSTHILE